MFKGLFKSILSQDMAKQAKQVEIITLIIFIALLIVVWWLWQFEIELTTLTEEGQRVVIGKMNIFKLLLLKQ